MLETSLKAGVGIVGAAMSFLYGGWSMLLQILVAFIVLDYITGLMSAWVSGELKSSVGLKGIAKKVFIFVMVAVGHLVDMALGNGPLVREAVIFFYIANEILSITENAGKAGIPVPAKISNAVEILKGKGGKEE